MFVPLQNNLLFGSPKSKPVKRMPGEEVYTIWSCLRFGGSLHVDACDERGPNAEIKVGRIIGFRMPARTYPHHSFSLFRELLLHSHPLNSPTRPALMMGV